MWFYWYGTDQHGRSRRGLSEVNDPAHLREYRREQGIALEGWYRLPDGFITALIRPAPRLTAARVGQFLRQLATLVRADIALVQSLEMILRDEPHKGLRRVVQAIRDQVLSGAPLSMAFAEHPRVFDNLTVGLVQAGEQASALDTLLVRIAEHHEQSETIRRRVRRALIYPAIVLGVALLVSGALLIFVVPRFESMFADFGAELPAFTQSVMDLSRWIRQSGWPWLVSGVVGLLGLTVAAPHVYRLRYARDTLLLYLPILGPILRRALIARFARTLAIMTHAGTPLAEALPTIANAMGNAPYQEAIVGIAHALRDGRSLEFAVSQSQRFPPSVAQMVAVGEESGRLSTMLASIAEREEARVEQSVDGLGTALEPLLMTTLGGIIGALVLAMYLPVFRLGSAL